MRGILKECYNILILSLQQWMEDLERPAEMTEVNATNFFGENGWEWHKNSLGKHKLVIKIKQCLPILQAVHDNIGHKCYFATRSILLQHFWWPHIHDNLEWFVKTCHICQTQQTKKVLIPLVVAMPAPLFGKIFIDTMHMPKSHGKKYIVQGRCSLSTWPEWRALASENTTAIQ